MKVAVVGATGMVGNVMLQTLEERNFHITELIPVASERSIGKTISFGAVKRRFSGTAITGHSVTFSMASTVFVPKKAHLMAQG